MRVEATQNPVVGAIFITNVIPTSTGNVPAQFKTFETIEAVSSLKKCRSDTPLVRVYFEIDGAPVQWRGWVMVTTPKMPGKKVIPTRMTGSARRWEGYVDVEAPYAGVLTAITDLGAKASVEYTPAFAGPSVLTVALGANPGAQSELKQNDTITISGTCETSAVQVEVVNAGIFSTGSGIISNGTFSFTATVSGNTGVLAATLKCKNAMGTYGDDFETVETKILNQTFPTVTIGTITYPLTQSALKGIETATVAMTTANLTTIGYDNNGTGEISITNPATDETPKTVTRTGGSYRESGFNLKVVANRAENDATITRYACIKIANVAPVIDISGLPSRLDSSPTGVIHGLSLASNQLLASAPTIILPSIGSLGAWGGSGKNRTNNLTILDTDAKGAGTFSGLSVTNEAGIIQTIINSGASYTCGGFSYRQISFGVTEYLKPIGTAVYDITKLTVTQNDFYAMSYYADVGDYGWSYTITDSGGTPNPNGDYIRITGLLANNGIDPYTIEIEESAIIAMVKPK